MTLVGKLPTLNENHTVTPQHHVLKAVFPGLPLKLSWTMSEASQKLNIMKSEMRGIYIYI